MCPFNKPIKTAVTNPKSSTATLPSYMLTPVSTMGTPTITLRVNQLEHPLKLLSRPSSVRVTNIDTHSGPSTLLQLIPDGAGGVTNSSSTPTLPSTTPKPQVLTIFKQNH